MQHASGDQRGAVRRCNCVCINYTNCINHQQKQFQCATDPRSDTYVLRKFTERLNTLMGGVLKAAGQRC
jgi:hypothetical protein